MEIELMPAWRLITGDVIINRGVIEKMATISPEDSADYIGVKFVGLKTVFKFSIKKSLWIERRTNIGHRKRPTNIGGAKID